MSAGRRTVVAMGGSGLRISCFFGTFFSRTASAHGDGNRLSGLSLAPFTAPDAPPGADPFSMQWCIVGWIDRHLLPGRLYLNTFDPEGLCSTLPAIVTAMLGMFCGDLLRSSRPSLTGGRKVVLMLAVAVSFAIVAALFAPLCPINKNLWTPTFVLAAGAYSVAMLALFYWIIDVKEWRGWSFPSALGMAASSLAMEYL